MFAVRALATGVLVGLLGALMLALPASAQAPAPESATGSELVTGEPWSSPAYPVACSESSRQVNCRPESPADVKAQRCFIHVLMSGRDVTVCTTYDQHRQAIASAGGTEVKVGYGCSVGDVVCVTFENAGRGMALATTAMMFSVSESLRFDTSTLLWDAAAGEWSFWAWVVLIVVFIAMIWAITAAAISGDRRELLGAILRSFVAFPATALSLWVIGTVLNSVDDLTWYILSRDGIGGLFGTLQKVMWAGGEANYFFGFLIHGLLMVGLILLMLVFTFRNIALAALIMVGPLAWMVFPVRGIGPQWVVRYFSAVIVLLLTAPLTIAFVTLIVNGLATMDTIWNPQAWPLLIGLVMVAFAPFAVFGLFSFVGAVAADSLGSSLGSRAVNAGRTASRTVSTIPTRLGASPAGMSGRPAIAGAGSSPSASGGRTGSAVTSPNRSPRSLSRIASTRAASPASSRTSPSAPTTTPPPTPPASRGERSSS